MGVKGEFKAASPAPNSNAKDAKKDISVETAPKRDYKDDVIEDLNNDLKKLQKSLTCVICLEMLFEPYALQCGHVFCYTCMLDWLDQAKKMTCPECRSVIRIKPAPAYLIRDMIEVFVLRAELSSPNGNGIELRKQQKEALKIVEKDRATEGRGGRNGLFHGLFRKKKKPPRVVQDPEDGVLRCPGCNWEIMDDGINRCEHCELRLRPLSRSGDFSDEDEDDDEDDSGSETESDRGGFSDIHPSFFESSEEEDWRPARHGDFAAHFGDDDEDDDDDHDNEEEDEDEDEDDDDEEAQYEDRMRDSSESIGGRDEPIILEDGSDTDEATRNVRRPPRIIPQVRGGTRRRAANFTETSDDEGSLADFIEHDTPENQRRPAPGRSGVAARSFFGNNPVVIYSFPGIVAPTRRNPRRNVIDDEEEDDQSSISEASSVHPRRGYTQRRGPIALPSDSGEDEIRNLLGYAPLNHTASENEDDSFASPLSGGVGVASHSNGPGSVFSVPEEDEEDEGDEDEESRAFGDDDESEDQDGDVRMGGSDQRSRVSGGQRATRNRTRGTRPHVIEDDSDSDSDVPTTRRRRIQATGNRSNYLRTNHRDSNSSRRQREIDPAFLNMFQQHSQAITEGRLESLGSMNQSVSPARSATPVQRNYTGGPSNRATRSTRESTRESRESTRELTPVQSAAQSSPPPPPPPIFQGINSTLASGSPASSSPAVSSNPQIQSLRPGTEARAGNESANNQTSLQSPRPVPITIGASPQASRMRTRNSRQQLRGTSSRSGLRPGSATATSTILQSAQPQGVAGTAAASGRQQSARPILTAAASRGRRGVPLTTEDIRARGEATLRRQRQEAAESANGLARRNSRRNLSSNTTNGNGASAPTPLVTVGRIGSSTLQGNGRRVGAVIGGAPGQGAGGGPMLIIDNGED